MAKTIAVDRSSIRKRSASSQGESRPWRGCACSIEESGDGDRVSICELRLEPTEHHLNCCIRCHTSVSRLSGCMCILFHKMLLETVGNVSQSVSNRKNHS